MTKLLFLFLLLPFAGHSQTFIVNVKVQDPMIGTYIGKIGPDSAYSLTERQSFLDSIRNGFQINKSQDAGILNLQQTDNDLYAKHRQDSAAIANIVIPPTQGLPQSITITASQTIPANFNYNGDIYVNCNSCTVTIPLAVKDWHWKLHNTGQFPFKIGYVNGLSKINSLSSMNKGVHMVDISFITGSQVEIH